MGPMNRAAVPQGGEDLGELNGCRQVEPLTDGSRNGFTLEPALTPGSLLPLSTRNQARHLTLDLDPRRTAQSEFLRIARDRIDPEFYTQLIKVHIATSQHGLVEVDISMTSRLPTPVGMATQAIVARAEDLFLRVENTFGKSSHSNDRLVGGPRWILAGDRPIP